MAPSGSNTSDSPPRGEPRSYQRVVTRRTRGQYLVSFPDGYYDSLSTTWPFLLFLHGADERGSDLDLVRRHGPLAASAPEDLPFVIVAPQCPTDEWWRPLDVTALVDECAEHYRLDEQRLYATGISMGGTGVWAAAAERPDLLAGVAPICGRADPLRASAVAQTPVWAFHGARDAVIPAEQSRTMVEAVRQSGGTGRLTIYPDAGHDAWTQTYAERDVYDWLLQHQQPVQRGR